MSKSNSEGNSSSRSYSSPNSTYGGSSQYSSYQQRTPLGRAVYDFPNNPNSLYSLKKKSKGKDLEERTGNYSNEIPPSLRYEKDKVCPTCRRPM